MSLSSGGDFKSQVLAATNIVELIGRTVALKQRGRKFLGLCPFHQEKTPSFNVDPSKQYFFCFGCKAGGNAIDFVMKRDRIEFVEALKLLGDQAGLERPSMGLSKRRSGERQNLLDMQSAACSFFEKSLADPVVGKAARDYLASRGFDSDTIRRFQIGFAPDGWDGLLTSPLMRKFQPGDLATAGLVKARERGGGHYDTFRNRLIFPIRDENARVIAFGGRAMPPAPKEIAKYLNSPDTPLFSKSRCVFGLDLARQRMIETRTAVVVEGYTDVVMAHQFGVRNVVSPLGTALTEPHVAILRRFADRIVLLFDADTAGEAAVDKAVGLFLTQPIEIAIASMPEGVDPDEYLLSHGAEAFEKLLDSAPDALSFKWKQLQSGYSASDNDLTGQQKAVSAYLDLLAAARGAGPVDGIRWGVALARVARLTGMPVDELNRRFTLKPVQPTRTAGRQEPLARAPLVTADQRAARWALGALMIEPHRWASVQHELSPPDFVEDRYVRLAEIYWNLQRDEGEPVFSELLGALPDPALVELAIQCVEEAEQLSDLETTLQTGLRHLSELRQKRRDQDKLLAARQRTSSDASSDEEEEILRLRSAEASARRSDLRRV